MYINDMELIYTVDILMTNGDRLLKEDCLISDYDKSPGEFVFESNNGTVLYIIPKHNIRYVAITTIERK